MSVCSILLWMLDVKVRPAPPMMVAVSSATIPFVDVTKPRITPPKPGKSSKTCRLGGVIL